MGWLARKFIRNYDSSSKPTERKRVAKCGHCGEITKQVYYHDIAMVYDKKNDGKWYCYNCSTMSDVGKCTCGYCESHPYTKTGLTEKDITQ